ncbi:hypothetical protein MMC25_005221 [Agyrium rufum]|nr:hypothetical protein [Agyrium rufum]
MFMSNDFTFDLAYLAIWSDLEPTLGIISSSLPVLRPVLTRLSALSAKLIFGFSERERKHKCNSRCPSNCSQNHLWSYPFLLSKSHGGSSRSGTTSSTSQRPMCDTLNANDRISRLWKVDSEGLPISPRLGIFNDIRGPDCCDESGHRDADGDSVLDGLEMEYGVYAMGMPRAMIRVRTDMSMRLPETLTLN